jgi:hypothetical protein
MGNKEARQRTTVQLTLKLPISLFCYLTTQTIVGVLFIVAKLVS